MSDWKFFTDEEMHKWIGPRCPDMEPGCVVCARWARRDLMRQWEYEDEQDRLEFLEMQERHPEWFCNPFNEDEDEDLDPYAGSEWTSGQQGGV